ncbi:hypothetical protein PCASD_02146 [Puccinia coronata f. sp. avenae]|uniref:Uncharacterized protein n=1 Tax=Puccinia coronata f. sp. avenae TaxID=200324 RepID=A0A2N5VQ25_9BASI|nr:hypothetical protein PCASD_02146 [Puccinia coronata f. sp. avenae]
MPFEIAETPVSLGPTSQVHLRFAQRPGNLSGNSLGNVSVNSAGNVLANTPPGPDRTQRGTSAYRQVAPYHQAS